MNKLVTTTKAEAITMTAPPQSNPQIIKQQKYLKNDENCKPTTLTPTFLVPKKKAVSNTKAYKTDFINNELLMGALRKFIRDQLKIDDELEDSKIQLVA